jgi:UrcA family protein
MKQTLKIMAISALATAAIIKAAPLLAEPATGQNVTIVSTSGIDLSSPAGRSELDHRLVNAAYEVCGSPSDADLVGKNRAIECRKDVLFEARAASSPLASNGSPIRIAAAR